MIDDAINDVSDPTGAARVRKNAVCACGAWAVWGSLATDADVEAWEAEHWVHGTPENRPCGRCAHLASEHGEGRCSAEGHDGGRCWCPGWVQHRDFWGSVGA